MSNSKELLTKAKSSLVIDHPFFASILLSIPLVEDSNIKTLATNGDEIRYNPEFVESLSLSENIFVMAHETLHCVLQHMYRRGSRDSNKWNIAADYTINDTLVNEKIGTMPKGCLFNSQLVKQGGNSTEGVYNLLPDNPSNNKPDDNGDQGDSPSRGASGYPKPGEPGGALDEVLDAGKDEAERGEKEAINRVKTIQAINAAKIQGKFSAGMARIVGDTIKPITDWRSVLRKFLLSKAKIEYTYAKPKRRFMADDIFLPSLTGEEMGSIVIAVDCSGSIDDKILEKFSVEIKAIVNDVMPEITHILYFDTEILKHDQYNVDDTIEITPHGGGGTAFSPIFKYIESNNINPVACVVLTDLCCYDFGNAPDYPVLWASTMAGNAPFGEILDISHSKKE